MRIGALAHLHHPIGQPYLGGLEAHTAQTCEALARRGHQVSLYAKQGSRLAEPSVRVVAMLEEGFTWRPGNQDDEIIVDEATRRACAAASAQNDVVLNNCLNPVPYVEMAETAMLTVLHTPATLERVNALVERPGWAPGPRHAWVSVSQSNAVGWREVLPEVTVGVVPNGIDLDQWPSVLDVDADAPLAWSARITPEKGLHVAIDAAMAAGMRLEVAGPISNQGYFEEQIQPRISVSEGRVRHLGHLPHDQLAALLGRSSAFCCTPLWEEPFGLAPLEAMACGTPVAALARGAVPELVGPDGGAMADGAEGLPEAIRRAVGMDRAAVRRRAEHFSQTAMVDNYLRILDGLRA